jgi:2'-5' RNA ligase
MRLFIGIALPPRVLDNLARVLQELRPLAPVHWSPVENLHITSKFIGPWPEERLAELQSALENLNFGRAFDVAIAGFGFFPNPHRPRTFFAGVSPAKPAESGLAELANRIDETLAPLGIAREDRPYSPHLTLARIKLEQIKQEDIRRLRQHIAQMTDFDFGAFQVSAFHLYLSKTGPSGSVYTPLATYPLLAAVKA